MLQRLRAGLPGFDALERMALFACPGMQVAYVHVLQQSSAQACFNWHTDTETEGYGAVRKTMVVLLSDTASSMQVQDEPEFVYSGVGAAALFDSDRIHRSGQASAGTLKIALMLKPMDVPPSVAVFASPVFRARKFVAWGSTQPGGLCDPGSPPQTVWVGRRGPRVAAAPHDLDLVGACPRLVALDLWWQRQQESRRGWASDTRLAPGACSEARDLACSTMHSPLSLQPSHFTHTCNMLTTTWCSPHTLQHAPVRAGRQADLRARRARGHAPGGLLRARGGGDGHTGVK